MKDLIKCIKLIKYSLQLKMMVILSVVFFAFGIVFEVSDFSHTSAYSLSALYLALTGLYLYQMVFTVSISKMVQASPLKKKLQTSAPMAVTLIGCIICFTIYTVIRVLRITPEYLADNDGTYAQSYSTILFMGVCIFVLLMYTSFSYKSYVFSIIFIAVTMVLLMFFGISKDIFIAVTEKLLIGNNPVLVIILGYVLIIVSAAAGYAISVLNYKKDISDMAVRFALRQANKG